MNIKDTNISDIKIIEPSVYTDNRGFFFESWNEEKFCSSFGKVHFVQDNHSKSIKGTLRGLHYQINNPQAKLVRVISGTVLDVAVDLRKNSETFKQSVSVLLTGENKRQLWIPEGFAHGFYVLSETAEFVYKCTNFYDPKSERTLLWNDPTINIDWNIQTAPIISEKDQNGLPLSKLELF
ncbi:dTDP-4-dehydrorhamnose 3,5-epimerase [Providencia huaxiensis]|uniref:dTDP-4-dehydrorhamnose 3,5-epimerase n=1 Tax=Providencia huaxiensis TaxID=2027290 RepID=UPI0034E57E2B